MTNEKVKIGIALAVGLGVGGGVGYYLAEQKVRKQSEAEVAKIQDLYNRLREEDAAQARADWNPEADDADEDRDVDPEAELAEFEEKAVDLGYIASDDYTPAKRNPNYIPPEPQYPGDEHFGEDVEEDLIEEVEKMRDIRIINPNRDSDPDDVTQWERDPNRPYVITESEFRNDRPDLEKITLSYYRGDDTLCEADGSFIPDQDGTAGNENLHHYFGLASGDENLLHVRNERVGCDFEITLDSGSYQREVLGFDVEDKMLGQSKKAIRRMRSSE